MVQKVPSRDERSPRRPIWKLPNQTGPVCECRPWEDGTAPQSYASGTHVQSGGDAPGYCSQVGRFPCPPPTQHLPEPGFDLLSPGIHGCLPLRKGWAPETLFINAEFSQNNILNAAGK